MEQLGSQCTDFRKTLYVTIFQNFVPKIRAIKNRTRTTGTLHVDLGIFVLISLWILLRMKTF